MAKQKLPYRLYYWSKSGKRTTLGKAYSYSIFYGKLKLQSKEKFPVRRKAEREEFLVLLVGEFEKLRKKAIRAKKQRELRKKKKDPLKYEEIEREEVDELGFERKKIRTYSPDYKKEYIDKIIVTKKYEPKGEYKIRILDFTLSEPVVVKTGENQDSLVLYLEEIFYPHMRKFIKDHKDISMNEFLGRVKYKEFIQNDRTGVVFERPGGYGTKRSRITLKSLDQYLKDFFFHWVMGIHDYILMSYGREIRITGFTMEVLLRRLF